MCNQNHSHSLSDRQKREIDLNTSLIGIVSINVTLFADIGSFQFCPSSFVCLCQPNSKLSLLSKQLIVCWRFHKLITDHIKCLKHHICQSFGWEFSLDQNEQHVTTDISAGNLVAPLSYLSSLVSPVGDQPCWWLDTPVGGLWFSGEIASLWLQQIRSGQDHGNSLFIARWDCGVYCVVCCKCFSEWYTKSTILWISVPRNPN